MTKRSLLRTAMLLLFTASALGGDGADLDLVVTNDGIVDVFVTIYDMSTNPPYAVMSRERINGFTSAPISVSADATGRGNISWSASSVDTRSRKCGRGNKNDLSNSASVNVHVDSDCAQ